MHFEAAVVLSVDNEGLSASFPNGPTRSIAWNAVDSVAIETNDSGPWGADVWWRFEGHPETLAYPQGATGEKEVLDLLSERFPGFDYDAMIGAMACTDNQRFVCWRRGAVPEDSVPRED